MTSHRRDAWAAFGVGLVARLMVVVWARGRFPAAQDGWYYDVLARRLASGAGFTWLWDNGTVTYAAHYPVGYPALLAVAYRLFGVSDTVAMTLGALLGAMAAYATHRVMDVPGAPRWSAAGAAYLVALHPALVPYAAARMTEAVTAALLMGATALAARARSSDGWRWTAATGAVLGLATLVRPQSLVLAPVLGALTDDGASTAAGRRALRALARAAVVTAIALACVAPWTARNCVRMHRCALVSVNGGWNLLIGATTDSGAWNPISVPPACATVWDEAAKDSCFGREAARIIGREPWGWAARVPAKLATTFDVLAAAPWYLHASNPGAFPERSTWLLGAAEILVVRATLIAAALALARVGGPRRSARWVVALAAVVAALSVHAWLAYVGLVVASCLLGVRRLAALPLIVPASAAVIAGTLVVHSVFFGAGRYGLVVVPFVAALGFVGRAACADPRTGAS